MKKYIILAVAILIIVAAIFSYFAVRKSNRVAINNLIALQDSVKHYKLKVHDLELNIAEKKALILTKNDAIKAGLIDKEYWRKLHMSTLATNVSLEAEIKAMADSLAVKPNTVFIKVKDTTGVYADYVKLPFVLLDIKSKDLNLTAGMHANKTAYYDLGIPIIGTITVGYKDRKPVGVFATDNKLFNVTNMTIIVVPSKKPWHEKWYLSGSLGFALGYGARSAIK